MHIQVSTKTSCVLKATVQSDVSGWAKAIANQSATKLEKRIFTDFGNEVEKEHGQRKYFARYR